jgi:hypothetical protein
MPPQYGEVPHTSGMPSRTTSPSVEAEDGGYLDDLIESSDRGDLGYRDPFPGGMGMDPSWSPEASNKPGYTAPFGMTDPTFGTPQSPPTMTNPMMPDGGWADVQGLNDPNPGMADPTWSPEASTPPENTPFGGWDDQQELEYGETKSMSDPRDEQQKFNWTNKKMDNARTEKADNEAKELASKAAEEYTARYGGDEASTKKRAEYVEKMNKMFRKQKIMMVLAAISGDPSIMQMAAGMAEIDMKQMDMEYGEYKNDRLRNMQKKFFFDKDGNYDPPKTTAAAWQALNAMGATPAEADAILGRMPEDSDKPSKNWIHNNGVDRVSSPTSPGPQWQEAGLAEGAKNPKDGKGSDTGQKGAQRDEIVRMRREVDQIEDIYGLGSPEHNEALENLELTERLYGAIQDIKSKDPMASTTMISKRWDAILAQFKNVGTGAISYKQFSKAYGLTGDDEVTNGEEFAEWFAKDVLKSSNNPIDPELVGGDVVASFKTAAEAQAAIDSGELQVEPGDFIMVGGERKEIKGT